MCKWRNETHVKNELIHWNTNFMVKSLKFNLLWTFKSCTKTLSNCRNPSLERVWGWRLTFPNELLFWELESQWTLEHSENDCKGQNTSHWGVFYIIWKLLKCRCLKWAHMTHLTSATQVMAKSKVRSQTTSLIPDHKKLGIDLTLVRAGGIWHIVGKLSMTAITLL
jgi:hypothetical protein